VHCQDLQALHLTGVRLPGLEPAPIQHCSKWGSGCQGRDGRASPICLEAAQALVPGTSYVKGTFVLSHKRSSLPRLQHSIYTHRAAIPVCFMSALRWVLGGNSTKPAHLVTITSPVYTVKNAS